MIEGSWAGRLYGISPFTHLRTTPSWVSVESIAGQLDERRISVYTTLSELRFASKEDGNTASPSDPESHASPISQLKFASPEETMTLMTPIELELPSRDSSLSSPTTYSSSPGIHDDQVQNTPSEELSLTTQTISPSASPKQPGGAMPRLDEPAILDSKRVGRRPLPEVPGHAQSRPLPTRPMKMATVPGWRTSDRFSYPPRQEFVQGSSKDPLPNSRPVPESGPDTLSQSVEEQRQNRGPTPSHTPPIHHTPAPPAVISPPAPSPSPPSSIVPLRLSAPVHPPVDILSPTGVDLVAAAGLTIIDENGEQISFGALFNDRKVVVIFLRYFWCLCCQRYVDSILKSITPETLEHKGVDLVLIGNGTPGAIKVYKRIIKVPFKVYTDPSLRLYNALGLYKTSNVRTEALCGRGGGRNHSKRDGPWESLRVVVRAAAARAVHNDLEQLGGEFVFGPGLKSSFVHKMQGPHCHAPISDVLEAAGVDVREKIKVRRPGVGSPISTTATSSVVDISITASSSTPEPPPTPTSTNISFVSVTSSVARVSTFSSGEGSSLSLMIPGHIAGAIGPEPPTPRIADETEWMRHRTQSLTRIKQKKEARRRGASCDDFSYPPLAEDGLS